MPKLENYPPVTLMMPVLNEQDYLESAVASILDQRYPGAIEILIELGPSIDKTDEVAAGIASRNPSVKLRNNPAGKTTVGLNSAIRDASHEIIARVDAHAELGRDYLKRGVEILLEQNADLVGGLMAARGEGAVQAAVAWSYNSRLGIGAAKYHVGGDAGEAESAYLGIFRKSALERVGGYDETIVRGEDWDLSQRIKDSGGLVWFSPELAVTYWPRESISAVAKQFYSTGVWRGDLSRRDLRRVSLRYWAPPTLTLVLITSVLLAVIVSPLALIAIAPYFLLLAGVAVTAKNLRIPGRLALLLVIPTIHFSWGLGFLRGFVFRAGATVDRSRV